MLPVIALMTKQLSVHLPSVTYLAGPYVLVHVAGDCLNDEAIVYSVTYLAHPYV